MTSRYCACGTRLAADHRDGSCAVCARRRADERRPPSLAVRAWETDQFRDAFAARHIGRVFLAYRTSPYHDQRISQEGLGGWLGLRQPQVSSIETGPPVHDLAKLVHWSRVLGLPRNRLWFQLPDETPSGPAADSSTSPSSGAPTPVADRWRSVAEFDHSVKADPANTEIAEGFPVAGQEEVERTNRRELVCGGAISGLAALAAERSREIAGADMDPPTLIDVEEDIDRFAAEYTLLPHAELMPEVTHRWRQIDAALGRRSTLKTRSRLTAAAGRLTYYLSRLSFNTGDFSAATRLAALASQYATQVNDQVILASVAGMNSGVAFYRHQYADAVTAFVAPDPPYLRARNAAYRARACAALGDTPAALVEVETMWSAELACPPQPGDLPLSVAGASMFTAATLIRCGDGEGAERHARDSVAAHEAAGTAAHAEEFGHALCVLAAALIRRANPQPEEAAALGSRAILLLEDRPTHTVTLRADRLARDLRVFSSVSAVADFRQLAEAAVGPDLTGAR